MAGRDCAVLFSNVDGHDHEGQLRAAGYVEPILNLVARNGRCERPECLTHLDHGIDAIAHLRVSGIREYAPMAERARAEFHSASVPGDHSPISNLRRCLATGRMERWEPTDFDEVLKLREREFDVVCRRGRAQEWDRHALVPDRADSGGPPERSSDCRTIVCRGGLNEDFIEAARLKQLPIRGAVQCYAAGQGESTQASAAACMFADMEQHPVQAFLKRGGHVAMLVEELGFRTAAWNEAVFEITASCSVILPVFASLIHTQHWNSDPPVVQSLNGLPKESPEPGGIAIRGQSHDLVLVGIEIETEMKRDQRVQDADGVVCGYFLERVELAAVGVIHGCAVRFAHSVDHYDQTFIPAGGVIRAGSMGEVVVYMMKAVRSKTW